jgi:hypothetical protein
MKSIPAMFLFLCALGLATVPPVRASGAELLEYDISWVGVSVGTMTVQSETNAAGNLLRSLRIWNHPLIALVYPVDTTVTCEIEQTPDGPRHTICKKVQENDFKQDDTLVLWPELGRAVWSNAVKGTVQTASVPKGSRDLVSFFYDLRDVVAQGGPLQVGGGYQLVMDGAIHDLEIQMGKPKRIRTPHGRMEAIPVDAISKSPTLFSRNRPRSVWVATSKPAVLFADVESRFGAVRATLVKWQIDGAVVSLKPEPPAR